MMKEGHAKKLKQDRGDYLETHKHDSVGFRTDKQTAGDAYYS